MKLKLKLNKTRYIILQWIGEAFDYPKLRSYSAWGKFVSSILCQDTTLQLICNNILFFVTGFNQTNLTAVKTHYVIRFYPYQLKQLFQKNYR
jgi:hypothetical protein